MDQLVCPSCSAPDVMSTSETTWACRRCGYRWMETRQPCPSCEHLNPPDAERCERCGEPLGVVSRVISRQGVKGPPAWLKQTRQRAAEIKDYEETVSSVRFEALADIDRRREAAEAREQALSRQRDRKVIWGTLLASLIFILVLLIFALLASRG